MKYNINLKKLPQIQVKRGDIYYADLKSGIGSEQGGRRPVLIIQNDVGNKYSNTVIAAAITSKRKKDLPTHIELHRKFGLVKDSVILLEQIRTIDKSRLHEKLGRLDENTMNEVDKAISISFGISLNPLDSPNKTAYKEENQPTINNGDIDNIDRDNDKILNNDIKSGGKTIMSNAFLDKLNKKNMSVNSEKSKDRVNEIWESSSKTSKRNLKNITGHSIYKTITVASKSGHVSAKTVILLSRYLDINPFYLTGESDEKESYSDDLMKQFLTKSGYKNLWKNYESFCKNADSIAAGNDINDISDISNISETANTISSDIGDIGNIDYTNDIDEKKVDGISSSISEHVELSPEIQTIIKNLTEEETIILLRALLIRAKIGDTEYSRLADKIKLLLLIN